MDGRLGNHRPGRAPGPAFRDIGFEGGDAGAAARQGVDMLVRGDALRRVDRQRMAKAEHQPLGDGIGQAAPFDLADLAFGVLEQEAAGGLPITLTTWPL